MLRLLLLLLCLLYSLQFLLAGGADPNTPYTLPETNQTITPLTWAAICESKGLNMTEYGYPGNMISNMLQAGANPLPDGPQHPPSALVYTKPTPFSKCNTLGACTAAEVDGIWNNTPIDTLPEGFSYGVWRELWDAQEAAFANPSLKPQPPNWLQRGMEYVCSSGQEYYNETVQGRIQQQQEEHYASMYPLHVAVPASNLSAVKQLIESGNTSVNSKDDQGLTPLQVGMECSNTDYWCWPRVNATVAEFLVSKGADVKLDVYPTTVPGYTLLHKAALHGLTRLVKVLIAGGADVNAVYYKPDDQEHTNPLTPLIEAATCDFRRSTNDGPNPDSTNGTIQALLD